MLVSSSLLSKTEYILLDKNIYSSVLSSISFNNCKNVLYIFLNRALCEKVLFDKLESYKYFIIISKEFSITLYVIELFPIYNSSIESIIILKYLLIIDD